MTLYDVLFLLANSYSFPSGSLLYWLHCIVVAVSVSYETNTHTAFGIIQTTITDRSVMIDYFI